MAHIAGLRMNLSHESWSETAAEEAKLESALSAEEAARLKAVKARKAAEKARREADEAKNAQEERYRIRQEEKARFTDQQRQWWDEEARHRAQGSDADYMAEVQGRSAVSAHEDLVGTQTKLINKKERSEKIRMERFHEDLEVQDRRRREAEALDQRDAVVSHLEEVSEALRQANLHAQQELAEETRKLQEQEASKQQEKFKLGEDERKKKEADRQEKEMTQINSKMKTEEHKQQMFTRDEAARATLKQRKDQIAKEKMQQGKKKQSELVNEIKKAEADAKRKKEEEKKAFHQQMRKKQAESTLVAEKNKRLAEERKAAELIREVELAKVEAEYAKGRAAMASEDLNKRKGTTETGKEVIATTKSQVDARTAYEAKMRAQFGSGDADPVTGMLKVW